MTDKKEEISTKELQKLLPDHPEFIGYMLLENYIITGATSLQQNTSHKRETSDG